MTNFFIGQDPSFFDELKERTPLLKTATMVLDESQLETILVSLAGNTFFFIPINGVSEEQKNWILTIRKKAPHAKLIYITDDKNAHALKVHQQTPIGGDAYVHQGTRPMDLADILETLKAPDIVKVDNRLEKAMKRNEFADFDGLDAMKNHPVSHQINELFKSVIKVKSKSPLWQSADKLAQPQQEDEEIDIADAGAPMSTQDKSLSLDLSNDLEMSQEGELMVEAEAQEEGLELSLDEGESLDLGEIEYKEVAQEEEGFGDLSFEEGDELSLSEGEEEEEVPAEEETIENLGELSFDEAPAEESAPEIPQDDELSLGELDLGGDLEISAPSSQEEAGDLSLADDELSLNEDISLDSDVALSSDGHLTAEESEGLSLSFDEDSELVLGEEADLSDDAKEKLKEIDAIMDFDATQAALNRNDLNLSEVEEEANDDLLDQPLVSDDLNLDSLNFGAEEEVEVPVAAPPEKKKKKETKEVARESTRDLGQDLKEISGAYSGEMERMQATISNLRSDREELLAKIQKLEDDKVLQNRQTLTLRAELDEKKIELTIIRKKLNEELTEMKDRLKLFDEKRLILEEKNRLLAAELDKAGQKNKIDVKKVQMRERELEQKLELLKADAETQIRNRDLKILELKRKIDAMEFDMESISQQEKRSVESRFELEDKLEKAIKTLRNAITVLEDESDRSNALSALKKNIDM